MTAPTTAASVDALVSGAGAAASCAASSCSLPWSMPACRSCRPCGDQWPRVTSDYVTGRNLADSCLMRQAGRRCAPKPADINRKLPRGLAH